MAERVYTHDLFTPDEALALQESGDWTQALLEKGAELGMRRQCSLGWHDECSLREMRGEAGVYCECECACHTDPKFVETVVVEWEVESSFKVVKYRDEYYVHETPAGWDEEDAHVIVMTEDELKALVEKLKGIVDG